MNIRRYYSAGQIVFITQIVKDRKPLFRDPEMITLLNDIFINVNKLHPFLMLAHVILPDHFHILIRPEGESNFSQIMHSLKSNFTREYKRKLHETGSVHVWQKRFWDHVIRDEQDLENHIFYIHYNPVKHGYVDDPGIWDSSSYVLWQNRGLYENSGEWVEPRNSLWGE
jgi:putative transposase